VPLNPNEAPRVLKHGLETLQTEMKDDPHLREFLSILTELANLPSAIDHDPERVAERQREKEVARERLARLVTISARIRQHIHDAVASFNGKAGNPASFDPLHALLEAQFYRLSYWKTASHEINYRRFFDVNLLAGVRMEEPEVFAATHRLTVRLLREGRVMALRLDHPDGLYDPSGYFDQLQAAFLEAWMQRLSGQESLSAEDRDALGEWRRAQIAADPQGLAARPLYLVGEKILSTNERLPKSWRLDGSSGYDFLNDLNRLFIDARHGDRFRELYSRFTGKRAPLDVVIYASKRLIMSTTMASELNVLAHALNRISEGNRRSRDYTLDSLRDVLREVVACFPVYRTYVNAAECTASDRQIIDRAISRARRRNPAMESSIFRFVRAVLIPHDVPDLTEAERRRRVEFSMKFQQYTGPVQAKGLEDTAFYRYNVLLSLNEVGGDPNRFGSSLQEFHDANSHRRREWPSSMLATATHDTKRGEDSRARLNALSEIPDLWQPRVEEWSTFAKAAKTPSESDKELLPDANDEYLFYQALLGAWSAHPQSETRQDLAVRLQAYMNKAIKEAKLRTSWIAPDEEYEKAVAHFVEEMIVGETSKTFWPSFEPLARQVAERGVVNSLAQVVLKIASPGVPDFYQGSELWDLSLVDPDNRRPVDYRQRQTLLDAMEPWLASEGKPPEERLEYLRALLDQWPDGRIKLFITAAALRLRRSGPGLFLEGDYTPLYASGAQADQAVAFTRRHGDSAIIAIVPRLFATLGKGWPVGKEVWKDTRLVFPEGWSASTFYNVLTGERCAIERREGITQIFVGDLLSSLPVALLINEAGFFGKPLTKDF
jgi:(1->4)-alpha-D-glucan 1-alpha-D-glucosylmutase